MKSGTGKKADNENKESLRRRDVLRAIGVGTGAAAMATSLALVEPAAAQGVSDAEKRKARYQPNSADVQNYYRVNRYPK
jgi:sugar (pentulose or hexulose) kinase